MRRFLLVTVASLLAGCSQYYSPPKALAADNALFSGFAKNVSNPVFTPGSVLWGTVDGIEEPFVVTDGATYYAFYPAGSDTVATRDIGLSTTPANSYPLGWSSYANKVLSRNSQAMDTVNVTAPVVIKMQDGSWRMYYHGYDGLNTRAGVAMATAGGFPYTWTKYAGNPILDVGSAGAWDNAQVRFDVVIPAWEAPDNTWHAFYGGWDGSTTWKIGHATSADGLSWTKDSANPLTAAFPSVPGTWENSDVFPFGWFKSDGLYFLLYMGNSSAAPTYAWTTGIATSTNLSTWTKASSNPFLPLGPGTAWDSGTVEVRNVVYDPIRKVLDVWYLGSPSNNLGKTYKVGMASRSLFLQFNGGTLFGATIH